MSPQMDRCECSDRKNTGTYTKSVWRGPAGSLCYPCIRVCQVVHCLCGTGLCGPSKFFFDLRIQVWFSGMLVSTETENLHTVAQTRSSSESHVLLRSWRWSLFNPQVLTLTGWDRVYRVDGLGTDLRSLVIPQWYTTICFESLSLSLFLCLLSQIRSRFIIHGLFLECVSMSICHNAISNLSRSFCLRHSTTGRFSDYSETGTVNGVWKRNTVWMCILWCVSLALTLTIHNKQHLCGRVRLEGIDPLLLLYLNLQINLYRCLQGTITSLQKWLSQWCILCCFFWRKNIF